MNNILTTGVGMKEGETVIVCSGRLCGKSLFRTELLRGVPEHVVILDDCNFVNYNIVEKTEEEKRNDVLLARFKECYDEVFKNMENNNTLPPIVHIGGGVPKHSGKYYNQGIITGSDDPTPQEIQMNRHERRKKDKEMKLRKG